MADYIGQITMRSGDQLPLFAATIEDDMGVAFDLSTASRVTLTLDHEDGFDPRVVPPVPPEPTLRLPASIVNPQQGLVVYDWDPSFRLRPGVVLLAAIVTLKAGGTVTAPTDRTARIIVRPDADVIAVP